MSTPEPGFALSDVDFDAVYQGKPLLEGVGVTFEIAPWDIKEPQPAVVNLVNDGQVQGQVLDVGCGLGENALFLATSGYRVTGVDGSASGLEQAGRRAAERGVEIEFVQDNATALTKLDAERYDTVLDSALYHCLDEDQRQSYAAALHRVTAPGARLHLLCFADIESGLGFPMSVSQDNLRANLGTHWDIEDIQPTTYTTSLTPELFANIGTAFADLGFTIDPDRIEVDEHGRILGPVWHLRATRR